MIVIRSLWSSWAKIMTIDLDRSILMFLPISFNKTSLGFTILLQNLLHSVKFADTVVFGDAS